MLKNEAKNSVTQKSDLKVASFHLEEDVSANSASLQLEQEAITPTIRGSKEEERQGMVAKNYIDQLLASIELPQHPE